MAHCGKAAQSRSRSMIRTQARRSARSVALAGALSLVAAILVMLADPGKAISTLRENGFDRMLALFPREASNDAPVIVDIDRQALAKFGAWPWPRDRLALLIDRIADAEPKALAIDILLPDRGSDSEDAALAKTIARVPTALGVVLDPEHGSNDVPETPVLLSGEVELPYLLAAPGAILPAPTLAAQAQGLGVLSLPVPEGEPVRAVALLTLAANKFIAGLAVEAVRLASGSTVLIAGTDPQMLRIGEHRLRLAPDGLMRLHFGRKADRERAIVRAADLLAG